MKNLMVTMRASEVFCRVGTTISKALHAPFGRVDRGKLHLSERQMATHPEFTIRTQECDSLALHPLKSSPAVAALNVPAKALT